MWYNALPEHQLALITSGCAPFRRCTPWSAPCCEDCGRLTASYGLAAEGGQRRWCAGCAKDHEGAIATEAAPPRRPPARRAGSQSLVAWQRKRKAWAMEQVQAKGPQDHGIAMKPAMKASEADRDAAIISILLSRRERGAVAKKEQWVAEAKMQAVKHLKKMNKKYATMTSPKLRAELLKRGLNTSGKKAVLMERLAVKAAAAAAAAAEDDDQGQRAAGPAPSDYSRNFLFLWKNGKAQYHGRGRPRDSDDKSSYNAARAAKGPERKKCEDCVKRKACFGLTVERERGPRWCFSLPFSTFCRFTAFHRPSAVSLPFIDLLPFHCFSLASHCLSLPFLALPLPFHQRLMPLPVVLQVWGLLENP